jgi:hypothetical protein
MGAPVVRRDELELELKKQNAKISKAKRELRAEITEYLEERLGRLEGALESVPAAYEYAPEDSAGKEPEVADLEDDAPGQTPDILSGLDSDEEGAE